MTTWREEMEAIVDAEFDARAGEGTLGDLDPLCERVRDGIVAMAQRCGVECSPADVEVSWEADHEGARALVGMTSAVEAALDAKAKPHLRLVEPVEDEATPAGAWTELIDFPPLAEGHKRLVVVKGTLPDEEVEHVANGVAEHLQANFGETVAVLVMRPDEAFGVSDFPPKPAGHRRVVTVESAYLDRAGFEGVKAWFKEAVGADDVVMAGAVVKVEDIPE